MNDNLNSIAEQVDRIDNLIAGLEMRIPAQMHIDQYKQILPDISQILKSAIIAETGEDVWDL